MPVADTRPLWKRAVRASLDLALLAGIVVAGRSVLRPAMHLANVRGEAREVGREARALHTAFTSYSERNGSFPNAWAEPRFDETSFDPLRRRGYYKGFVLPKLVNGSVDAYDSPDDAGENAEFWLEMTLALDPRIRFLVARSDDAPLGGGRWLDGAFIYRNGSLEPL